MRESRTNPPVQKDVKKAGQSAHILRSVFTVLVGVAFVVCYLPSPAGIRQTLVQNTSLQLSTTLTTANALVTVAPQDSLKINAVNPGYGTNNAGELIELINLSGVDTLSLTGFSLRYTNKKGDISTIVKFPEGSTMTGERLLLRYSGSPEASLSDLKYTITIAQEAGPLELLYQDAVVDSICWTGTAPCKEPFKSTNKTTLVQDTNTITFSHISDYQPPYESGRTVYVVPSSGGSESTSDETPIESKCQGLQFSELLTYYESEKSEQFIEIINTANSAINPTGCHLRYKKKLYPLSENISPGEYFVYRPTTFTLTKNPTTSNLVELLDTTGEVLDAVEYPHGQKKSTSYALFGQQKDGVKDWRRTYRPTPGADNIYQEFRSCPAGKVINEATGNCIKAATLAVAAKDCPAGKYRNSETGRCKSYGTESTAKDCPAGYERNPDTNRCRKIKVNTGASFALVPETGEEKTTFIAFGALGLILLTGIFYTIYQFRQEICKIWRRFSRPAVKAISVLRDRALHQHHPPGR